MTATAEVSMPGRIRALPRDRHGRPIPWFVATLASGERDFRIAGGDRRVTALRQKLCWVCGQQLPRQFVFVLGPMCTLNRITGEPPAHDVCAEYSVKACPFLNRPQMVRRTGGLPDDEDLVQPAGDHLDRNPGGAVLWRTNTYTVTHVPAGLGGRPGSLIKVGDPIDVTWWRDGRPATRAEAAALLDAGAAILVDRASGDPDPDLALKMLDRQYAAARRWLPPVSPASAVTLA